MATLVSIVAVNLHYTWQSVTHHTPVALVKTRVSSISIDRKLIKLLH